MDFSKVCALKMAMATIVVVPSLTLAAWNHFDPADTSKVPKKFSATGFYSNMGTKVVTTEAVAFEVNSPLWSDNAHKNRWVLLKPRSKKFSLIPMPTFWIILIAPFLSSLSA